MLLGLLKQQDKVPLKFGAQRATNMTKNAGKKNLKRNLIVLVDDTRCWKNALASLPCHMTDHKCWRERM